MKPVPGICDRCGQRYALEDLKMLYIMSKKTGLLVCEECWEESHPQLDTRHIRTDDKEFVKDSRSDRNELAESRRLFGFNPVGHQSTGLAVSALGRVRVTS